MSAVGNKIRSSIKSAKLWAGAFVGYVFVSTPVFCYMLYDTAHSTLREVIVNGETHYIGYAKPIDQQREMHMRLSTIAAIAMYGRNPKGLDDIYTVNRIFSTPCQKLILEGLKKDEQIFLASNMSQKFQPDRPAVEVPVSSDACTMLVEGDIVSVRQENGVTIPGSQAMRLIFRLERNARFGDDGKYEMVVTRFSADYLKEHQSPNLTQNK